MICLAHPNDRPGMTALWQEAFGDPKEYIDLFFNNRMEWRNALLYKDRDTVAGQLFILPCQLSTPERSYLCGYIYSVATRKAHRGQGISTQLLEHAHQLLWERGFHLAALAPASSSLFSFYGSRGYTPQGYIRKEIIGAGRLEKKNDELTLSPISPLEILELRQQYYGSAFLRWDEGSIRYIVKENRFLGGQFYGFSLDGQPGFAACVPYEDKLLIKEMACPDKDVERVLNKLHSIYNKNQYILWLSNTSSRGEETALSMCRWLTEPAWTGHFYISHILD